MEGRSAEDGVDVEERFATPATELELDVASARDVDDGVTEVAERSVGIELEVWDGSGAPPWELVEVCWLGEGSAEGDSDGEGRGSSDGEEGGGGGGGVVEEVDAATVLLLWHVFFAWPGGGLGVLCT